MPNRVIHFEINADKPERAAKFYGDVFGWKIEKWSGPMDYWLVMTGEKDSKEPGINGGIMGRVKGENTTNTVGVDNIDAYVKKVEKAGGKVMMPKSKIEGVGWFARCLDSEGNAFGIIQPLPPSEMKMQAPGKQKQPSKGKKK